jgi:hypothetical protein
MMNNAKITAYAIALLMVAFLTLDQYLAIRQIQRTQAWLVKLNCEAIMRR